MRGKRLLCFLTLLVIPHYAARAQEASGGLSLNLRKDFGFSLGGRVQGQFTLSASGPEDISSVAFLIDGETMGTDEESPFQISFRTSDYELGLHRLMVVGTTFDGRELRSDELRLEFVSPEQGWRSAVEMVVPLLLLLLVLGALGFAVLVIFGRRGKFQIGAYGRAGAAVCPRCRLPYGRHVLSPNLFIGKLERCPHCSKWAIVRRATSKDLADAEARWLAESQRGVMQSEDEETRLRRMIEDTRFED